FHVRGFNEQGTTTTPFDMVVLNGMSRYHLCIEALRRVRDARAPKLVEACRDMLARHQRYVRDHFEDMPAVRDRTWSEEGACRPFASSAPPPARRRSSSLSTSSGSGRGRSRPAQSRGSATPALASPCEKGPTPRSSAPSTSPTAGRRSRRPSP